MLEKVRYISRDGGPDIRQLQKCMLFQICPYLVYIKFKNDICISLLYRLQLCTSLLNYLLKSEVNLLKIVLCRFEIA